MNMRRAYTSWQYVRGVLAVGAVSACAYAAPSASDGALAETLFRDAKALIAAEKYAEACPKLAESQRLDPAGGTLLTLALCYESEGKTASAWATFNDAAAWAAKDGRADRARVAKGHGVALFANLSRITLHVAPSTAAFAGFELKRDGTLLGAGSFDVAMPVDPGMHEVTATAPGYKPWVITVSVGADADTKTLFVPELEAESAEPLRPVPLALAAPPREAEQRSKGNSKRVAAYLVGGAGVVALGAGTYWGLQAKSKHDDATGRCPSNPCPDESASQLNSDAKTSANLAIVGFGLGLIGIGVGTYLWLTSPSGPPSAALSASGTPARIRVMPSIGQGGSRLWVMGSW